MTPTYRDWARFWNRVFAGVFAVTLLLGVVRFRPTGARWLPFLVANLLIGFDTWLLGLVLPALFLRLRKGRDHGRQGPDPD